MRHTIIAAVSVVLVAAYSAFTFFYIGGFTKEIETQIELAQNDAATLQTGEKIEEIYQNKRAVLLFLMNREHINEVEQNIIKLKNATMYNNTESAHRYLNLLKSSIEEIKQQNNNTF